MSPDMATPPKSFAPIPAGNRLGLAWPTANHSLLDAPPRFFAATRANPDYGRPGWTRDCGSAFTAAATSPR